MRNLGYLFLVIFLASAAIAQNKNVRKASRALDKMELKEAMEWINPAIENEKTEDKAKTWYTYGQIYQKVTDKGDSLGLDVDNPLEKAVKGYRTAMELENNETAVYYLYSDQNMQQLWGQYLNDAVNQYQDGNMQDALEALDKVKTVKPDDTTAYIYAASIALEEQEWDKAEENYEKLIELGYQNPQMYNALIYIENSVREDPEAALEMIKRARKVYPENTDLLKAEINYYIVNEKIPEAKERIEEAIEAEPENANLYFNKGYLLEELGQVDSALMAYKQATEIDPEYFEPTFNIGVIYYNRAAEKFKEANNLDMKEYRKRGKKIEEEGKEFFKKSLPWLEKAAEIRPEDTQTLETLQGVYYRLDMQDKADEVQKQIDSLK